MPKFIINKKVFNKIFKRKRRIEDGKSGDEYYKNIAIANNAKQFVDKIKNMIHEDKDIDTIQKAAEIYITTSISDSWIDKMGDYQMPKLEKGAPVIRKNGHSTADSIKDIIECLDEDNDNKKNKHDDSIASRAYSIYYMQERQKELLKELSELPLPKPEFIKIRNGIYKRAKWCEVDINADLTASSFSNMLPPHPAHIASARDDAICAITYGAKFLEEKRRREDEEMINAHQVILTGGKRNGKTMVKNEAMMRVTLTYEQAMNMCNLSLEDLHSIKGFDKMGMHQQLDTMIKMMKGRVKS